MRSFLHLFSGVRVHTGEANLTDREGWSLSVVLLIGGMVPNAILSREFTQSDPAESIHSSSASESAAGLDFPRFSRQLEAG
jgi:hypothetical protein